MAADPLASRARTSPRGLALVDRGDPPTRLTWAQLDAMAGVWAHRLASAGIRRGDRVVVAEPAGAGWAALLHACIRVGAVIIPLSPRAHQDERDRLVEQARPHAVIRQGVVELRKSGLRCEGDLSLMFTSGTQGPPKPVRHTLANHRASARGCFESLGKRRGDSWLGILSPHHVGGFAIFMRSVLHGQPVVTVPRFDERAVIAALHDERPTLVSAVPSMITRLIDAGGVDALARARAILVGGAPATEDEVRGWVALGLNVCPTYGMTETCSQVATVPPGRALELLGTAGFVHREATVTIEDGLITVSGPVVSPSLGGTVATGDAGHFDDRGALVVTGRRDDVIITGGEKVHPTEVEAVLRRHPGVRDAAVAGRPDRVYGRVLEALIVPRDAPSAEAIVAWSRERLPAYQVPRRVRFVESLPRSDSGKLLRRDL